MAVAVVEAPSLTAHFEDVPVTKLIPGEYQRPLDEAWVARKAKSFRPALFQPLTVTRRDGYYSVVDGNHRLNLARKLGFVSVPCEVKDLTPTEEAQTFVALQSERRSIHTVHRFNAEVISNDPDAIAIKAITLKHGYAVSTRTGQNSIAAVGVLRYLYRRGLLDRTLETMRAAWDLDERNSDGLILRAMGMVVEGWYDRITDQGVDALADVPIANIARRARSKVAHKSNHQDAPAFAAREIRTVLGVRGGPSSGRRING